MKLMLRVLPAVLVVAIGCGTDPDGARGDRRSAEFAARCKMTVRLTDADGTVRPSPIIEPAHVASIEPAPALVPGEHAVTVNLTAAGERRMQLHTRDKIGQSAVVYCGEREALRARIMEPLGKSFRLNVGDIELP
jgi:hypothetical protein